MGIARSIVGKVLLVGKFEGNINVDKFLFLLLVMSCESFGAVVHGVFRVLGDSMDAQRFQRLISYLAPDMVRGPACAVHTGWCTLRTHTHEA